MAAAVDAYHAARVAGHPVVAIVVGTALSGGFLAHGLQANQILALDDPGVEIHAMHKAAAARITLRTVEELDELAKTILPMSYDVRDWAQAGFLRRPAGGRERRRTHPERRREVRRGGRRRRRRARRGPRDLSNRLDSDAAVTTRHASRAVRELLARQWNSADVTPPRPTTCEAVGQRASETLPADAPSWARHALTATPWVVVRRAAAPDGLVAVGIRGQRQIPAPCVECRPQDVRRVLRKISPMSPHPATRWRRSAR